MVEELVCVVVDVLVVTPLSVVVEELGSYVVVSTGLVVMVVVVVEFIAWVVFEGTVALD